MNTKMPSQSDLLRRYTYANGQLYYRERVSRRCKAGTVAGAVGQNGYRMTIIKGIPYKVHRLIWKWHYGSEPDMIDHINGDRADNRIENLRAADARLNGWNRKAARDLPPCIYHHQGRFRVRMRLGGRRNVSVGMFSTLKEAVEARDRALADYGENSSV